ncbi:MAG TPA: ABC transporter permease subunit [Aurantimonas coralicida]|uniref:ABC transporter permease subunit n=2 Tax=root TaxID=1 RepID=A0A9C9TJZ0_9HYPH|nr:ABC transporter permease subunit [Aurantimonas coralicida]HEU03363.1 ABC transporter permease subunit [Aurantimonas coralicida]
MTGVAILLVYVGLFAGAALAVGLVRRRIGRRQDLTSLKTVTFGDESAIRPDRAASIISILVVFLLWGAFTGSALVPFHVPGPFIGETSFTYEARDEAGQTQSGEVLVYAGVAPTSGEPPDAEVVASVPRGRDQLIPLPDGAKAVSVDGAAIAAGDKLRVAHGTVSMTGKGTLSFAADKGLQMEPIWLPSPEAVAARFVEIAQTGYQNYTLWEHLGASLMRVLVGFALGSLMGIPLGYAMGLSGWFRGWFDPIVEFMRPVPPLALIPLVIIWFGIWETGKIVLLFLAALWIMTIAARAGVSGVNITKVHAAYSLGASKWQLLRHVIMPNSLPEIFTGARVAMGVCWGTVVAAELVAAQKGAGMMIIAASKFQLTDIVLMGIILIGIIGYGIDVLMRLAERKLVPWKGRS